MSARREYINFLKEEALRNYMNSMENNRLEIGNSFYFMEEGYSDGMNNLNYQPFRNLVWSPEAMRRLIVCVPERQLDLKSYLLNYEPTNWDRCLCVCPFCLRQRGTANPNYIWPEQWSLAEYLRFLRADESDMQRFNSSRFFTHEAQRDQSTLDYSNSSPYNFYPAGMSTPWMYDEEGIPYIRNEYSSPIMSEQRSNNYTSSAPNLSHWYSSHQNRSHERYSEGEILSRSPNTTGIVAEEQVNSQTESLNSSFGGMLDLFEQSVRRYSSMMGYSPGSEKQDSSRDEH